MHAMGRQRLVLAGLAALALAYGIPRALHLLEPGEGSMSVPSVGEQAGAPSEILVSGSAAVPPRDHASVASGPGVNAPAPGPDWPIMLETAFDDPPRHLGKPLDADGGEARESIALPLDPIDIGPALDADDPLGSVPARPLAPDRILGVPLDAGDPRASPTVDQGSVRIGPNLDADDPQGSDMDQPAVSAIEIGGLLDAGAPRNH